MSQGSGSPVAILDAETCKNILQDLRGADGKLPDFNSVGSDPRSPLPALEAEVAHGEQATQTSPVQTQDQATFVLVAPGPRSVSDQATQVVSRPHQGTSYTQTPPLCSYIRTGHPSPSTAPTFRGLHSNGDGPQEHQVLMDPSPSHSNERLWHRHAPGAGDLEWLQAGAYFDNEIIPPGAPRSKLLWVNTYAQFDALLAVYPDVHPEDFITYGILQAQPRRGSYSEWGAVAGVLSHMVGGKRILANELSVIIHRIQHLERDDPMRATEKEALVAVVMRERRRLRDPHHTAGPNRGPTGPSSASATVINFRPSAWAVGCPGRTSPWFITPAWALWDPGGTSTSRTATGALGGPGWLTSSLTRLRDGRPHSRRGLRGRADG